MQSLQGRAGRENPARTQEEKLALLQLQEGGERRGEGSGEGLKMLLGGREGRGSLPRTGGP